MRKLQTQGAHHITIVGADRQTSIDFWEGVLGMSLMGLLIELASYRFEPPGGHTHAEVLLEAHRLRVERGDYNIDQEHLADAIELLVKRSRESLSDDRAPKDPYEIGRSTWATR